MQKKSNRSFRSISLMLVLVVCFLINQNSLAVAQTLAFPSAEGYGRFTTGGRGGSVIEVTNLNDSGPGSLRRAVETNETRTIVFRVSGNINLESELKIEHDNITIAGQTAPGDGICIKNYSVKVDANNVIIRYLRFRLGDLFNQESDAIWGRRKRNIIIDHCSMSWSVDEAASFYDNENFTLQWCIISESLNNSIHSKGEHGYGGIWGGRGATFHHNLLAHHTDRNPRFNGSRYSGLPDEEIVDFVNNVIYNWGKNSAYGGEAGNHNIRKNYYKYGPATSSSKQNRIIQPYDTVSNWYVDGNYVFGYSEITMDNWAGGVQGSYAAYQKSKMISEPFPIADVETQSAEEAYELVLIDAGASFPKRDSIDTRVVYEAETGTAQYGFQYNGGGNGIIDSQTDVGGWPILNSAEPLIDTDHDGMPDVWEEANGLNPNDDSDRNLLNDEGYTKLEEYINDIENILTSFQEEKVFDSFNLYQNYPNPFNPVTTIKYSIPLNEKRKTSDVQILVYDVLGQKIETLVNKAHKPGNYEVKFIASNLTSGVYYYKLKYGNFVQTKKMILIK